MYKKVKVIMLPSEKDEALTPIGKFVDTDKLFYRTNEDIPRGEGQHLYITSDDEIKEGDIILLKSIGKGQIGKHSFDKEYQTHDLTTLNDVHYPYKTKEYFNKIIASTDKSLTFYSDKEIGGFSGDMPLPSLPEDFIKEYIIAYNNGDKVDEARVKYDEGVVGKDFEDRTPEDEIIYWPITDPKDGSIAIRIYSYIKNSWNKKEVEALLFKLHKTKNVTHNFNFYDWVKENLK